MNVRNKSYELMAAMAKSFLVKTIRLGGILSAIVVFLVMLLVIADILGRTLFNHPLPGVLEISEILLVFIVFSAVSLAQAAKKQIRVDLLLRKLSQRKALTIDLMVLLLSLFYVSFMAITTSRLAYLSVLQNEYRFGLMNVPTWPARLIIGLGTALLTAQVLSEIVQNLKQHVKPKDESPGMTTISGQEKHRNRSA